MRQTPREINAQETFDRLVSWIERKIRADNIPGIIVGVSGTDSVLTFLACYHAYKRLGKPERALAVNFVHHETRADGPAIKCETGDKNWFADQVMPWLKEAAPGASFEINESIPFSDDNQRWGHLFSRALQEVAAHQDLGGRYHYVAGTRNHTEKILGTYTLISKNPSLQPIEHLYKTEVLKICRYLGVPQIALDKSREIDCACGRFEIQAHHVDELDAFIMTEKGEIAPAYLDTIDPNILMAVREFYVEETMRNAFREEIPYRAPADIIALAGLDIQTAEKACNASDPTAITRMTPVIIEDGNADAAHRLLTATPSNKPAWRAETYALLGTRGMTPLQRRESVESVLGRMPSQCADSHIAALADISSRIGQYGFSFPAKRFIAMGFGNGPSLIERAGFRRLVRDNDVRNSELPKSDPARDDFGTGFVWHDDDWYIEQRRAYFIVSRLSAENPVTLLVRNSSPYFGRDRLAEPVYVSFEPHTPETLQNLTRADIEIFTPWHNLAVGIRPENLERLQDALDFADQADLKFGQWLRSRGIPKFKAGNHSLASLFNQKGGSHELHAFLKFAFMNHISQDRQGSPVYLAALPKGAAPWRPDPALPVNVDFLSHLNIYNRGGTIHHPVLRTLFRQALVTPIRQLVLLSSPQGDYPVAMPV